MTKLDAQEITAMLAAYYTNWHPSDEQLTLYENLIIDFDADETKAELIHHMRTDPSEFVPKVATFARRAAMRQMAADGRPVLAPEEAWEQVRLAIRRDGYYRKPSITHPMIVRAIDALGWLELCGSERPEADRAHFFKIFSSLQERSVSEAVDKSVLAITGNAPLAIERN